MVTHYDDKSIRITSTTVQVMDRTFPLAEISAAWHHRGSRSWRVLAGRGAIGAALAVPLVAAVAGIVLALWLSSSPTITIAIIGASVLVGLAAGPVADFLFEHLDRSYARGSRRLEIWIRWQGRPMLLLATADALRFGQIYRALQRAIEASQPAPRPPHPAARSDRSRATSP
ncbi:DUF6232 family protein [Salinispora oceanensis]|uniref:DUF6232 family protein n=1 Tax=Salinispora oceanensis TaxID=1050199 RepID=UPI0003A90DC2|nr:DUF6232 family protein [Salinispora oceanensis]